MFLSNMDYPMADRVFELTNHRIRPRNEEEAWNNKCNQSYSNLQKQPEFNFLGDHHGSFEFDRNGIDLVSSERQ